MRFHLVNSSPHFRKWFGLSLIAICFGVLSPLHINADDCYPKKPQGLVADQAGLLTDREEALLNQKLIQFNQETSNQILIVTILELCEGDAAMTAYAIGEKWGVGQGKLDNGIVVLVKPKTSDSRGQAFIATGYGLEGAIPDATAKVIVENEMIPRFRGENFYAGIDQATTVLMELAAGEYSYKDYQKKDRKGGILSLLPILFFIFIWFMIRYSKTRSYARNNHLGFWAAWALMNSASRSHRGSYGNFSSGSGSFGGFGGFGGGSFGGGGAGGSW